MLALHRLLPLLLALVIASIAGSVWAQTDESDETRIAADKAKRRHYAGGKDEQELAVQPVIVAPTRYPTDPKPAATGASKEPAQEDIHD